MSLDAGRFLQRLSESFLQGAVFELTTAYERSNAAGVGLLLGQLRNQLEGAVALLLEENNALTRLFADAAGQLDDVELCGRLAEAARGGEVEFRVPPLRARNEALRALLVDLHAHVERVGHVGLETRIWQELAASVQRRERQAAGDPGG